jgi:sugar phosphate permease
MMMGALQGPLFPASSTFLAKWTPPDERTFASSALDTGISIGE